MTRKGSNCKYCDAEIRWVRVEIGKNETTRVPLDVAAVTTGGQYAVAGADTAMRVPKAARGRYSKLYRKHDCDQAEEAKKLQARARRDAADRFGWRQVR